MAQRKIVREDLRLHELEALPIIHRIRGEMYNAPGMGMVFDFEVSDQDIEEMIPDVTRQTLPAYSNEFVEISAYYRRQYGESVIVTGKERLIAFCKANKWAYLDEPNYSGIAIRVQIDDAIDRVGVNNYVNELRLKAPPVPRPQSDRYQP